MNFLYFIPDNFTFGLLTAFLNILSALVILTSISVIVTKNPVTSVLYLIALFVAIALYLSTIGLNFIGLAYLLVYVGAVSILFLFILMLINIRVSELLSETRNSLPLVLMVTVFLSIVLGDAQSYLNVFKDNLFNFFKMNWDSSLTEANHITAIGDILYTNLAIWLIVTSIILLLAMVGAIVITLRPTEENSDKDINFPSLQHDFSIVLLATVCLVPLV